MSYTDGSWIEERHKKEPDRIVDIRSADGTIPIATMFRGLTPKSEFESNVKMIKAAPKLFEALKTARTELLKRGITVDNADLYNTIDRAIKEAEL